MSEQSFESKSSESNEENSNEDQIDQEQDEDDQIDENEDEDQHSQSQQNDDYECDEEGRPKGVSKLFNLIKEDLGETQSESFKLFYDLMSNQIKYCLQNYIENDEDGQEQNSSQNQLEESKLDRKKDNNNKPLISPLVLANLLQQQKSLILNVVDQQQDRIINESKQQKSQLKQQSQDTLSFKNFKASSQQVIEERKIKLKLKPRNQQTKQHMINKNKNHLIMINTTNTKELKVILEYLADKQCELPINKVLLRTSNRKFTVEQQSLKIQELIKNEKPIEQKENEPAVYQIMYDILESTKGKNAGQKRSFKENQISLINTKQDGKRGFQDLSKMSALSDDEDEDLEDEDLIAMFTEVFSIILLNKRKKFLKLKHLDKDARLPHPSSLLSKSKKNKSEYESKSKRREIKQQLKSEHEKQFKTKDSRLSEQISFGMNSSKGSQNLAFLQDKQANNPEDSQFELFETNPYFHQLMKQRNINQQSKQDNS